MGNHGQRTWLTIHASQVTYNGRKLMNGDGMRATGGPCQVRYDPEILDDDTTWLTPFRLPDGRYTAEPKAYTKHSKDFAKTKTLLSFDVSGLSVLDVGCSEGLYSFYLAEQGATVLGIDIDERRIRRARFVKDALGIDNVSFECGSILDPSFRSRLPRFDLALAWGLLHRVPDPFNALVTLCTLCDAVSLEWRAPRMLFPPGFSGAIHGLAGTFEWKNMETCTSGDHSAMSAAGGDGLADFWRITPAAAAAIARRAGFKTFSDSTIYREGGVIRIIASWLMVVLRCAFRRREPFDWSPSRRVHMVAQKQTGRLRLKQPERGQLALAKWDGRFSRELYPPLGDQCAGPQGPTDRRENDLRLARCICHR